jgi:hypothetical protein
MSGDIKTVVRFMRTLYSKDDPFVVVVRQPAEAVVVDVPGVEQSWHTPGSPPELYVEDAWLIVNNARGECITNDLTWEDQEAAIQAYQENLEAREMDRLADLYNEYKCYIMEGPNV